MKKFLKALVVLAVFSFSATCFSSTADAHAFPVARKVVRASAVGGAKVGKVAGKTVLKAGKFALRTTGKATYKTAKFVLGCGCN